jgi:hypothetical protein
MKKHIFLGFILFILASCSNPIDESNLIDQELPSSDEDTTIFEEFNTEEEVDLSKFNLVRSIRYTKGSFETSLEAYYDGDAPEVFIEKYTISNGNYGERKYLFNNNKLSKVSDFHEIMNEEENNSFITEVDYLYENEVLVKSSKKEGNDYDAFSEMQPVIGKENPEMPHVQYLKNLLGQKEQFELFFLDISDFGQNGFFLHVGEKNGKGLECFFKIDTPDAFLEDLMNNQSKYYNKPINVNFDYRTEQNGGEFMFYVSGSFKE